MTCEWRVVGVRGGWCQPESVADRLSSLRANARRRRYVAMSAGTLSELRASPVVVTLLNAGQRPMGDQILAGQQLPRGAAQRKQISQC